MLIDFNIFQRGKRGKRAQAASTLQENNLAAANGSPRNNGSSLPGAVPSSPVDVLLETGQRVVCPPKKEVASASQGNLTGNGSPRKNSSSLARGGLVGTATVQPETSQEVAQTSRKGSKTSDKGGAGAEGGGGGKASSKTGGSGKGAVRGTVADNPKLSPLRMLQSESEVTTRDAANGQKWKIGVSVGGTATIPLNLGGFAGRCKSWFGKVSTPRASKKKGDMSPKKCERGKSDSSRKGFDKDGMGSSKSFGSDARHKMHGLHDDASRVYESQETAPGSQRHSKAAKKRSKVKNHSREIKDGEMVLSSSKMTQEPTHPDRVCRPSGTRPEQAVSPLSQYVSPVAVLNDGYPEVDAGVNADDSELWARIAELVGSWVLPSESLNECSVHASSASSSCNGVSFPARRGPHDAVEWASVVHRNADLSSQVSKGNQPGQLAPSTPQPRLVVGTAGVSAAVVSSSVAADTAGFMPPSVAVSGLSPLSFSSEQALDSSVRTDQELDSKNWDKVRTVGEWKSGLIVGAGSKRGGSACLALAGDVVVTDDAHVGLPDEEDRGSVDKPVNDDIRALDKFNSQSTIEVSSGEVASMRPLSDDGEDLSDGCVSPDCHRGKVGQFSLGISGLQPLRELGEEEDTFLQSTCRSHNKMPKESLSSIINKALTFREWDGKSSPCMVQDKVRRCYSMSRTIGKQSRQYADEYDIDAAVGFRGEYYDDDEGDGEVDDAVFDPNRIPPSSLDVSACHDVYSQDDFDSKGVVSLQGSSSMSDWEEMIASDDYNGEVIDDCATSGVQNAHLKPARAVSSELGERSDEQSGTAGSIVSDQHRCRLPSDDALLERCENDIPIIDACEPFASDTRVGRVSDGVEELAKAVLAMAAEDGWSITDGLETSTPVHGAVVISNDLSEMDDTDGAYPEGMCADSFSACGGDGDEEMQDGALDVASTFQTGHVAGTERMDIESAGEVEQGEWNGSDSSYELPEVVVKARKRAPQDWVVVGMGNDPEGHGSKTKRDLSIYAERTGESPFIRPLSREAIQNVLGDACTKLVFYSTSMRAVRKTFDTCQEVRQILKCHAVEVDERDVSIDCGYREELRRLLGMRTIQLPQVFIKGRYIGGLEEVHQMNETEELTALLQGLPRRSPYDLCEGCADLRFLVCTSCHGSRKVILPDFLTERCSNCNEYGLERCPICNHS